MLYLGIDTSNYTTSAAVYNSETGEIIQKRKLLSVKTGALGLRQSDAVFQHILNLPDIINGVLPAAGEKLSCAAVSVSPDERAGSYMPCFMAGRTAAGLIASALGIDIKYFSHQLGHIAAALYSAGRQDMFNKEFIAFHISGGTTQAVKVMPDKEKIFTAVPISSSLDLKAGQAIDRVGKLLGLPFPAGPELDILSRKSAAVYKIRPFVKNGCCSLSGLQNKCEKMKSDGEASENIAKFCIEFICAAIEAMTEYALGIYPRLPVLYSGGVMSNSFIREQISAKFKSAVFAAKGFSSDNAAGLAVLAACEPC